MTKFGELLKALASGGVEFIIVGGLAAVAHGSPRATFDVDIVYRRSSANFEALVRAIAPLNPALRGAPPGLPFRFDAPTLRAGLNFTLTTTLGWLDLLGEIAGGGTYDSLLPVSDEVSVGGSTFRVLNLEALIRAKRAAGRPKDLEGISELEILRDRKR